MKTAEEIKEVMKASLDGKRIQSRNMHLYPSDWVDEDELFYEWDWAHYDYRVKPEDKSIDIINSEYDEIMKRANLYMLKYYDEISKLPIDNVIEKVYFEASQEQQDIDTEHAWKLIEKMQSQFCNFEAFKQAIKSKK